MRLTQPLLQLPIGFDAETLAAEVRALPAAAWEPHPQKFPGNEAVPLVAYGGELNNSVAGPMGPTEYLLRCPYMMEMMAELGGVWGRSRLMGLGAGADVPPHVDINYYWRTHLRIHIPVITNPEVMFTCGDESVHMAAGECWVFDSFQLHTVRNRGADQRVHLVLDTVGSEHLWDMIASAEAAGAGPQERPTLRPGEGQSDDLVFEQINVPKVMSPWEIQCHIAYLAERTVPDPMVAPVMKRLGKFVAGWTAAWARFGTSDQGEETYRQLIEATRDDLYGMAADHLVLSNGRKLFFFLDALLFANALAQEKTRKLIEVAAPIGELPAAAIEPAARPAAPAVAPPSSRDQFDRPAFIVSTPRSGSTLLFETLAQAPGLYTVGGESHGVIERISGLTPAARGWSSNRLTAEDATPEAVEQMAAAFHERLRDRAGNAPYGRARMLEKTPKNALRVPFLDAAWPDAMFVYLYRDPRQTMASMIEAWTSGRFRTYPRMPGWDGPPWSLLLVPGWQRFKGWPVPQIVAQQWAITTRTLLEDLARLPRERVRVVVSSEFLATPQAEMERLAYSLDLGWDRPLTSELPLAKHTVSRPDPDKWRAVEDLITGVWPVVEQADADARAFVASLRS
ncbi:MAG: sulfotransferase [Sphingomicrobium sp.]